MKKIIVSAAVAALALTTTASALEDIKVNGQTKVWYETDNAEQGNPATPGDILNKTDSSAEVAMKLGMTGKQGNVSFEGELTYGSTVGLEGELVNSTRTGNVNTGIYASKANITVPVGSNTALKLGRQELNTPLAFTEKWNSQQNNFDAAVLVNSSVKNTTIIGAYVGQTNTDNSFKTSVGFNQMHEGAYAVGALYGKDDLAVNAWLYHVNNAMVGSYSAPTMELGGALALWIDAGMTFGATDVKAYFTAIDPTRIEDGETYAYALSAAHKVNGWTLSGAASTVDENSLIYVGNVATGGKKTKLPTAGVYTDGLFVGQPGSTAIKLKAAGKVGSTGLAVQLINNTNDNNVAKETTELDIIASAKLGDFNIKGILMHRMFDDDATDNASGGQYIRLVTSVNF